MTTPLQPHSPAPWRVFPTQDQPFRLEIVDSEGCTVAVLDSSDEVGGGMEDDATLTSDAALMAAAPDMLAALVSARIALARIKELGVVPWTHTDIGWGLHGIDAVIAKAKGGAQ